MSYASVAATNAPPLSQQPHPDPALLNTSPPSTTNVVDDTAKVNVVPQDYKSHPTTTIPEARHQIFDDDDEDDGGDHPRKRKLNRHVREAREEGYYIWDMTKHYLLRPGVAGGLVGLVNIGLLAGAGRAFYNDPHLRRDRKAITSSIAATLAVLSVEGYAAEKYHKTPRGRKEMQRAKEEGSLIYKHLRENILRPGVLGGLLGLLNTALLGTVGYFSYVNWDKPSWDRRIVSSVTIALLLLWGGEGYVAEQYHEKRR